MRAINALCAGTLLVLLAWAAAQAGDDTGFGLVALFPENVRAASAAGITGGAAAISAQPHFPLAHPSDINVADANQRRATLHHPRFTRVGFADPDCISTLIDQRRPIWKMPLTVPLSAEPKVS